MGAEPLRLVRTTSHVPFIISLSCTARILISAKQGPVLHTLRTDRAICLFYVFNKCWASACLLTGKIKIMFINSPSILSHNKSAAARVQQLANLKKEKGKQRKANTPFFLAMWLEISPKLAPHNKLPILHSSAILSAHASKVQHFKSLNKSTFILNAFCIAQIMQTKEAAQTICWLNSREKSILRRE